MCFFLRAWLLVINVPLVLVGAGSGFEVGGTFGFIREGFSKLSLVMSPSLFKGTGGNLLVGYGDLVFCAEMRVTDGPLVLGLAGIGLLFIGEGVSPNSLYCFPVLALRGMRLVLTAGFQVRERV